MPPIATDPGPHVRFVAKCQLRLNAPQQTALSARNTNPTAISWCDRWNELRGEK
jgi:hypothetical protein